MFNLLGCADAPPLPAVLEQIVLFITLLNEEPGPSCPHSVSFSGKETNRPLLLHIHRPAGDKQGCSVIRHCVNGHHTSSEWFVRLRLDDDSLSWWDSLVRAVFLQCIFTSSTHKAPFTKLMFRGTQSEIHSQKIEKLKLDHFNVYLFYENYCIL